VLAFGLAAVLFLAALDGLTETVQSWLAIAPPEAWYGWLWVAPLRALAFLARWILILAFAAAVYLMFTLVGGILASPFLDVLSRRVERLQTGGVVDVGGEGFANAVSATLRVAWEEAKRTFFFLAVEALLLALAFVPGLQVVAVPLGFGFAALFLPLDHAGYLLDRRGIPFRLRRRWVWDNRIGVGGFGAAAVVLFGVPGLNFLALPWLVTAATLLVIEIGPPAPSTQPSSRPSAVRR
jgi:CysZ protein